MRGKLKTRTPDVGEVVALIDKRGWATGPHEPDRLCPLQALAIVMTGDRRDWCAPAVLDTGTRLFAPPILRHHPDLVGRTTEVVWMFNDMVAGSWLQVRGLLLEAVPA